MYTRGLKKSLAYDLKSQCRCILSHHQCTWNESGGSEADILMIGGKED